jgi:uncharacterized protein YjdB/alpha-tubulin suppressor-like RCC1 family protein
VSIKRRRHAVNHRQCAILFGGAVALVIAGLSCSSSGGADKISGPSSPAVPVATKLIFAQQPTRTLLGRALNPVVTVQTVDAQGSLVSTGSVTVSLALRTSDGAPALLSGAATQASVGGVATFSGLAAAVDGDNMTLVASAPALAAATSEKFKVDPPPVAIDSTVLHLVSDSTTRAGGLYVFQASGSGNFGLDSGKVMVGAEQGGFLRRIIHMDRTGGTVRVQTVAANLDEVMQDDSIVVHLTLGGGASAIRAQRGLIASRPPRFVPATAAVAATSAAGEYTVKNLTLYADTSSGKGLLVTNAAMSLHPTVDLHVTWGGLFSPKSAHLTFGGTATFDATYDIGLSQAVAPSGSYLLGQIEYPFTIPVPTPFGPVPIPAVFSVPITLEWSASATGKIALEFGWTSTTNTSVGVDWTSGAGWVPISTATLNISPVLPSLQVNASLSARLGLKATPRLVVAGTLGGDLWAQPYAEGVATADLVQNQWATSCHSAVELGVDLDLTFFGFIIGAYNKSATFLDTPWPVCAHSGTIVPVPAPVASVTVSPATASIAVGGTQQFAATLKDASGNTLSGRTVTWSTSNASIATVNSATGVATGVAAGTATITATSEGQGGTAAVTVNPVPVASVTVSPGSSTINVGATVQLTATTKDANGNVLTGRVITWSTSNSALATVNATGVVTGVAAGGPVTITATSEGQSGTGAVTVSVVPVVPVASVTVSPGSSTINVGATVQLTATTKDANGNVLTGRVITWSTSNSSLATVSATGVVTGVAAGGPVTITATSEGQGGTAAVTVTAVPVVPVASVTVSPASSTINVGTTVQLAATTKDANGNVLTGRVVTWTSSDNALATVSSSGLVTGVAAGGPVTITATSEGQSGTAAVTVTAVPVVPVASVTVSPASSTINVGTTVQLTATTKDANGNVLTGRVITWSTSNSSLATVSATGVVTGVAAGGPVTITATSEGQGGTAAVTVTAVPAVPVASVTVSPASSTINVGTTVQLAATTKDANGNVLTGRVVTWTSSDNALATVSSSGLVTGVAAGGPVTITATSEGQSGTAAVTVNPIPVASVTVSPGSSTINVGATVQLAATTKDANGNVLTGRVVTWTSSNNALATVSSSGLVTGVAAGGPVTITATSEGQSGAGAVTVTAVPVASVTVSPASSTINVGTTVQLAATTKDANGNVLTGRVVTWTSSDNALATVSSSGLVTGVAAGGPVTITATSEGQSGTAAVTVLSATFNLTSLAAGFFHTCGLTSGGAAYCWGRGNGLGDGTGQGRLTPTQVAGGLTFTSVAGGLLHTCGLTSGGAAYCWGNNVEGELGDGTTTDRLTPTQVAGGLTFTRIALGHYFSCGLTSGGAAYCWGHNDYGQLGDGTTSGEACGAPVSSLTCRLTPTQVAGGLTFISLVVGGYHACGLTSGGAAYCWGRNESGALGDGTITNRLTPTPVAGGLTFTSIAGVGAFHTCGLTSGGAAYCWGFNRNGELGDGTLGDENSRLTPTPVVGGLTFTSLALGWEHTCGLTSGGAAYCWGYNFYGELGDGTTMGRLTPTQVAGGFTFISLAIEGEQTCGLTSGGAAYCWGHNNYGQLGDGTTTDRLTPTPVARP